MPKPGSRQVSWSIVRLLNQPVATATATAVTLIGFVLTLSPLIGSSLALTLIGVPLLTWGALRFAVRATSPTGRILRVVIVGILGVGLTLIAVQPLVEPDPVEFYFDGLPLIATSDGSPLAGSSFPPLTDDPATGREIDSITEPSQLTVSCWANGRFEGDDLQWARLVDGPYTTLWVPLADLGAMGRGSVRTILPCSHWRWQLSRAQ